MATSIASQLQALKSLVQVDTEVPKRPITRPSVLFDPKEAADLDIDTILSTALSGLEVLVNIDERFRNHKNDLFSHKSRELDRELMNIEENNRINASISSYLRLLSGHLQSPSSLKTLEYLVRRYKIHVYNIEELILCALPYHDTHAFVRIVQLIDFGNSRWKFLDGVKVSGAPPPREVIVQQCIRDMGLLEVICSYATPAKKHQPSTPVISFCTAVVVEVLGSLGNVDTEVVKRILPFLNSGLQSGGKGSSDYKAGTLMIVSLLANKVSLSPKLVSSLVRSVSELARIDAHASEDIQWVQLSIMALINIVQLQTVEVLPKKAVDNLKEIRDLPEVLSKLTTRFNIDRFLTLLLESLVDYSNSDSQCKLALVNIIEAVTMGGLVQGVVFRLLSSCLRSSQNADATISSEFGIWVKQILLTLNNKYPNELRAAVRDFLEDKKVQPKGEKSVIEALSKVLDGNMGPAVDFSESKIWFALDHPKAEIRRSTLSNLDLSAVLDGKVPSQRFLTIQDAVIRCLSDDDLSVVQAALSLSRLPELVDFTFLLETCKKLLHRCVEILWIGTPKDLPRAGEVAISCLKLATSVLPEHSEAVEAIATMLLPLLFVFPKTKMVNLKALELAKEINWPFYKDVISVSDLKKDFKMKGGEEWISEVNLAIVRSLVDSFWTNAKELMPWFIKCCSESEFSKTVVFLVLLHSFTMKKSAGIELSTYDACFAFLKTNWRTLEHAENLLCGQVLDTTLLDADNTEFLKDLDVFHMKELNARILVSVFWRLVKAYISMMPALVHDGKEMHMLRDLYVFFSESDSNHLFKEHRHFLVENCQSSPMEFLSRFFSEQEISSTVQVESLHSLARLCSEANEASAVQLLAGFPLILVPLSSDMQDVRTAAMHYVEELSSLCSRVKHGEKKNGNSESWSSFIDELLNLLLQQKKLILSDRDFLPSFLASLLSPSFKSLLVPQDVGMKFEKAAVDRILAFILGSATKFPGYAKLRILSLLKELGSTIVQVKDVECLLSELLQRRLGYHFRHDKAYQELTNIDVDILCLLIEICSMPVSFDARVIEKHILPALWIDGMASDDAVIVRPCVTFLQKLNGNIYKSLGAEMQQSLSRQLVLFYHDANTDVQNATRETLSRLDISCSTVVHMLNSVLMCDSVGSAPRKKKKTTKHQPDMFLGGGNVLGFLSSLLDVLLLKKDIESRDLLLEPLFQLLGKAFSNEWVHVGSQQEWVQASSGTSQTISNTLCYIQQTLLLILEDIVASLSNDTLPRAAFDKFDAALLVDCARSTTDVVTRNHVYSLFAAITKIEPDKVLPHIPNIITVIGESAVNHSDSHSRRVFEDFISTVVPCWLSVIDGPEKLLQIFVNVMPNMASDRRLSIVLHLLKTLGESCSLGSLLLLLFRSLVSSEKYSSFDDDITSGFISSEIQTEWQYNFASQVCEQYTCMIWLPSLVSMLKQLQTGDQNREWFLTVMISLKFILEKLQDPEFVFKLQSVEGMETIQETLCELMVQVVCCWQLVDSSGKKKSVSTVLKKSLKEDFHSALMKTTKGMLPSAFFQGIIRLLVQQDKVTMKKALQILCETVRDGEVLRSKRDKGSNSHLRSSWHHLEGSNFDSFVALCSEILKLLDAPHNDHNGSVRLAAISALEVLASKFPSNHMVFSKSLACVVKNVLSDDIAVVSSCLRASGALINVLGPRAMPELPHIMKNLLKRTQDVLVSSGLCKESAEENGSRPASKGSIMSAVLVTLEALVDNLGAFLNPYLSDIVELMVLHPDYLSESDQKLKSKADGVRRQLSEKVPVRLALPAIQNVYPKAVKLGDVSLCAVFDLLKNFVGKMDRASVNGYHASIFDHCMLALDLRNQHLASIKNVGIVEKHAIDAIIALTMKMTETMFKPLFIRSIEWAESNLEEGDHTGGKNIRRAISFYGLVNNLAENHRSLFVPYFKYLVDNSIRYLTDDDGNNDGQLRKKKKAKKSESGKLLASELSALESWHLRALILSSLHKCFLYDTGSLKFLDSSKFQLLLKPIVSQLIAKPPALLEEHPDMPSVKEVDDILVMCLGQMAVTASSDLLWKPLNYEVLMQTRSEMVRSRLLGLRVIRYLVENLKEEYLVLLAETIPFLAELLEDVELPVKTLAQDILKELESLSGENLREYF